MRELVDYFNDIVIHLPPEVQDLIIRHTIKGSCYQTLIDFLLSYPIRFSEYPSPPLEEAKLANTSNSNITSASQIPFFKYRGFKKISKLYLYHIIDLFDYIIDYGIICLNLRGSEIRLRSITMQTNDGNNLLKAFEMAGTQNLRLKIFHPPGLQDSLKVMKYSSELTLDSRQAMDFYARNNQLLPALMLNISLQFGVLEVIDILKDPKYKNLKEINVSIYDKEINEQLIENLNTLINMSPATVSFNCHVTYPSMSELTFLTSTCLTGNSLKLLSDFHKKHKTRSSLTYEVFLFFVDSSQQFTKYINCERVNHLYVCHPGPNTTDFNKLDWGKFTGLKQMHIKVLHLYLSYLNDCLPPYLQKLKLNFGSFRSDVTDNDWRVPSSIIELEIDTFPTGEGPMESLLASVNWSIANVRKLCLCWNKVFDSRGHMILLLKTLPDSLELLDIAGCGYEVVLICDETPSFIKSPSPDHAKRIYYSGEYGSVVINEGGQQYCLSWMGKA